MSRRPRRLLAAVPAAALLAVLLVLAAAVPAGAATPPRPRLTADTAIVIDAKTGEVLYGLHPDKRHAIASTTKLMTALLTRERSGLDDIFTVPNYRPSPAESQIGLKKGERLTVRDLLEALMLPSANDAAVTIATGVAGSRSAFVELMNAKARQLGLTGTMYANPIGLDDPDNYSTAHDLARLASVLLHDRPIAHIVDLPRARLSSGARPRTVVNRNRLVGAYPFVNGVKTGHTSQAGYVLVGSATRAGVHVISVVTGEPGEGGRDADSLTLLRYGLAQFHRVRAITQHHRFARASVKYFDGKHVGLVAGRGVTLTIRRGERVAKQVDAPGQLKGPLPAGQAVGSVTVSYRGHVVRRVPLVTADPVPKAGALRRLGSGIGGAGTAVAFVFLALLAGLAVLRIRAARGRGRRTARGGNRR
ncbi:MAG: hypothetical protein QOJ07_887 [Thermoleophilaceae bacterium]|nr:hypothetical protein [Thermoleophilaceae bacterium]